MGWLLLRSGALVPPNHLEWYEFGSLPRPLDFFRALFAEVSGIKLGRLAITDEQVEPREMRIVQGFYGNSETGLKITEQLSLYSSMFPLRATDESYGLPGIEVIWEYDWEKVGQGGYCRFQHRKLQARFDTHETQEQFERIWREIFGAEPQFQPADSGEPKESFHGE